MTSVPMIFITKNLKYIFTYSHNTYAKRIKKIITSKQTSTQRKQKPSNMLLFLQGQESRINVNNIIFHSFTIFNPLSQQEKHRQ